MAAGKCVGDTRLSCMYVIAYSLFTGRSELNDVEKHENINVVSPGIIKDMRKIYPENIR